MGGVGETISINILLEVMKRIIARIGMFLVIGLCVIGPGIVFYILEGWRGVLIVYIPLSIVVLIMFAHDWCNKNI